MSLTTTPACPTAPSLPSSESSEQQISHTLKTFVARMVAESTYFSTLYCKDQQFHLAPEFLSNKKISNKMRTKLVQWIEELSEDFDYKPETFFLGVTILDKYLALSEETTGQLQLVGATVVYIASKIIQAKLVTPQAYAYSSGDVFTPDQLLKKEKEILVKLGFKTDFPLALKFVKKLGVQLSSAEYQQCIDLLTILDQSVDSYQYSRLELAEFVVVLVKTGKIDGLTMERLVGEAQRLDKLFD